MMEDHEFCDDCDGCRPAIASVDPKTGMAAPMPQDHPVMVAINEYWDNDTHYAQRKAFIEVTLHNSRLPNEMKLFQEVSERMALIMKQEMSDD